MSRWKVCFVCRLATYRLVELPFEIVSGNGLLAVKRGSLTISCGSRIKYEFDLDRHQPRRQVSSCCCWLPCLVGHWKIEEIRGNGFFSS